MKKQYRARVSDHGVVLRHGDSNFDDQLGARDVWAWEHDGEFFLHYDAAGANGWLAALATSPDGVEWTKHGPVLELGEEGAPDSASASYGTVYYDGERWHMFYLGTPNVTDDGFRTPAFPYRTLKAEADSPRGPWTKRADVIPFKNAAGSWYDDTASPGQVVKHDDEYLMLFSAATTIDGLTKRTLGLARTTDLNGTWVVDDEPILPLDEQIENSSLYFQESDSTWFLFTNHVTWNDDRTEEYTDAVLMYWSSDPTTFSSENRAVLLDGAMTNWSPRVIGLPSVIPVGDRLAVYYDGWAGAGESHGRRDVGLAYVELPITD